jgi:hypothetical protein
MKEIEELPEIAIVPDRVRAGVNVRVESTVIRGLESSSMVTKPAQVVFTTNPVEVAAGTVNTLSR